MSTFTKLYIAGWLFLITVELLGVFWNFHDLDTMTANYRYVTERIPIVDLLLTIGLITLWFHLVSPEKFFK